MGEVAAAEITAFLDEVDVGDVAAVVPLRGGANNRVYRVEAGTTYCLKWFAPLGTDGHDRYERELSFVAAAAGRGVPAIPELLHASPATRMALYEFVPGGRPAVAVASPDMVDATAHFLTALNRPPYGERDRRLADAVDACFTLDQHLESVARRVRHLTEAAAEGALPEPCAVLVHEVVLPRWEVAREEAQAGAAAAGWSMGRELPPEQRWLSPSDIGFHNTIAADDRLVFVDFEYAGWDDPAKTMADFFSQPDYDVDPQTFARFAALLTTLPDAAWHAARARAVVGLHRVKWACIVLNDFLPVVAERRRQVFGADGSEARLDHQLAKANHMLSTPPARETIDQP